MLNPARKYRNQHPGKQYSSEQTQQRAKEKYGTGYRTNPPKHNRRLWQHFIDRNKALIREGYSRCTGPVKNVLAARERFWKEHLNATTLTLRRERAFSERSHIRLSQ
jgi:hypothetical protein